MLLFNPYILDAKAFRGDSCVTVSMVIGDTVKAADVRKIDKLSIDTAVRNGIEYDSDAEYAKVVFSDNEYTNLSDAQNSGYAKFAVPDYIPQELIEQWVCTGISEFQDAFGNRITVEKVTYKK